MFWEIWNNKKYQSSREIFSGKENGIKTICHSCPIPHIQPEMNQPYQKML